MNATATISIVASAFGYESSTLVALPLKSAFAPLVPLETYNMTCAPSSASLWLSLGSGGTIIANLSNAATVTGIVGDTNLGVIGAGCHVSGVVGSAAVSAKVLVFAPRPWTSLSYSSHSIIVTIGEASLPLAVQDASPGLLAPMRFSASCSVPSGFNANFSFDEMTGVGSVSGHFVFALNLQLGTLSFAPSSSLEQVFADNLGAVPLAPSRRTFTLTCNVYGTYVQPYPEIPPEVVKSTPLSVAIWSSFCVVPRVANFGGKVAISETNGLAGCWSSCRLDTTCTDFYVDESGMCYHMTSLCVAGSCAITDQAVYSVVPNCGGEDSCFNFKLPSFGARFTGLYCPVGSDSLGTVFLKQGQTVEDTLYLSKYNPDRDFGPVANDDVFCQPGCYIWKASAPGQDFTDSKGLMWLAGANLLCRCVAYDYPEQDLMSAIHEYGYVSDSQITAEVHIPTCSDPNITGDVPTSGGSGVATVVLDDLGTSGFADFWLDPCDCFPEGWTGPPVDAGALADVPIGSGNIFVPGAVQLLQGDFTCAGLPLNYVQTTDASVCTAMCQGNQACAFFYISSSENACYMYTACEKLALISGAGGTLYAMPSSSGGPYCRVANAALCWAVSGRRTFLQANLEPITCAWMDLMQQCDTLYMLGSSNLKSCSGCMYKAVSSNASFGFKQPLPASFQHGQKLSASCWSERYVALTGPAGNTLTCRGGNWTGPSNLNALDGFACGACIQVVSPMYETYMSKGVQELYFLNDVPMNFLVGNLVYNNIAGNELFLSDSTTAGGLLFRTRPGVLLPAKTISNITTPSLCLDAQASGPYGNSTCTTPPTSAQQIVEATFAAHLGSVLAGTMPATMPAAVCCSSGSPGASMAAFIGTFVACPAAYGLSSFTWEPLKTFQPSCAPGWGTKMTLHSSKFWPSLNIWVSSQEAAGRLLNWTYGQGGAEHVLTGTVQLGPDGQGGFTIINASTFMNFAVHGAQDAQAFISNVDPHADSFPLEGNFNIHQTVSGSMVEWTLTDLLLANEIANNNVTCPAGSMLAGFNITSQGFDFQCVAMPTLQCAVHTRFADLPYGSEIEFLSFATLDLLSASCPARQLLQGFSYSVTVSDFPSNPSSVGIRYTCCTPDMQSLSPPPVEVRATPGPSSLGRLQNEGLFCPMDKDASGRLTYNNVLPFVPQSGVDPYPNILKYDWFSARWCFNSITVSGIDCASGDAADPTQLPEGAADWVAVPVTNFNGVFTGTATAPSSSTKGPALIPYHVTQPAYAAECQADVTPGATGFSLKKMNLVGLGLGEENPCRLVAGKWTFSNGKWQPQGMAWKEDGGQDAGMTYSDAVQCEQRSWAWQVAEAAANRDYTWESTNNDFSMDAMQFTACVGIPSAITAPLGMGLEFSGREICDATFEFAKSAWGVADLRKFTQEDEKRWDEANADCDPLAAFMARTFCDLHCIRDVTEAGTTAVLKSLDTAVNVVEKNINTLMGYYTGEILAAMPHNATDPTQMAKGIRSMFVEMGHLAKRPVEPHGQASLTRALDEFTVRLGRINHGHQPPHDTLKDLDAESQKLFSVLRAASGEPLPKPQRVAREHVKFAKQIRSTLKLRSGVLSLYKERAHKTKHSQGGLQSRAAVLQDILDEMRSNTVQSILLNFDNSWWSARHVLDEYLNTFDEEIAAYDGVFSMLQSYTAECESDFADLHKVYTHGMAMADKAHELLRRAWTSVADSLGLIMNQLEDTGAFSQLLWADAHAVRVEHLGENKSSICSGSEDAPGIVLAAITSNTLHSTSLKVLDQVHSLVTDLRLLQGHFVAAGQTPPEMKAVSEAWQVMHASYQEAKDQLLDVASAAADRLRNTQC